MSGLAKPSGGHTRTSTSTSTSASPITPDLLTLVMVAAEKIWEVETTSCCLSLLGTLLQHLLSLLTWPNCCFLLLSALLLPYTTLVLLLLFLLPTLLTPPQSWPHLVGGGDFASCCCCCCCAVLLCESSNYKLGV